MIRQSLMPKEMFRDWKVWPVGEDLGDSAKRQKEIPKIESLGVLQQAESDPQRYYGKVWSNLTVKEY